jgi:peptide/nickel transport system substrate-binding protein
LAESWEVSEDGLTWTIKTDKGATFSDGTPANAQDIVDFVKWYDGLESLRYWYHSIYAMESIVAVDDTTIEWTMTEPSRVFLVDQLFFTIAPMSVTADITEEDLFGFDNYPPIGSGPYVVSEYEPGSHAIFDVRPEFTREKPPIDRIVWQFFSNPDAMIAALLSGDIDMTGWIGPEHYDLLNDEPNIEVFQQKAANKYELEFNMAPEGIKHPAIEDLDVRRAIDYAINRQQLIDVALLGHGVICPTNWACPPVMTNQLNPDLTATPYDPEMAKQILDDAGYVDSDGDGIRETPDGLPLEFRLFFQLEDSPELTISDLISGWLAEIGIATEVEGIEHGMAAQGILNDRDFDMLIYNMFTDPDGATHMDFTISCWAAESGDVGRNYPGWCNEEFEDKLYTALNALDPEVFEQNLFEAQAIINNEIPFITLAGIDRLQAYRSDQLEFEAEGTCHDQEGGLFSYYPLMSVEVK